MISSYERTQGNPQTYKGVEIVDFGYGEQQPHKQMYADDFTQAEPSMPAQYMALNQLMKNQEQYKYMDR